MEPIRILVAVADYPDNNGRRPMMYVHTRNIFYKKHGIDVTVLNFSAKDSYIMDNIKVLALNTFKTDFHHYDVLVCHAPNLRNHYRFLKKFGNLFPQFVFFFHGHEVLKINEVYSKPYDYVSKSKIKKFLQNCYDDFKLKLWHNFYLEQIGKSHFVFVSKWMLNEFLKWTKIPFERIKDCYSVTYNAVGELFESSSYNALSNKEFDFITIRSNLDGSKYAIDIVNRIAYDNPNLKFLVIGKGTFFSHYEKANNIVWLDKTLTHKEIIDYLQTARCALMPTRTDAQGVMMCEMASTGMPLITSDMPVCHEVFNEFENVAYIANDATSYIEIDELIIKLEYNLPYVKNNKFFNAITNQAEIELFFNLFKGN